MWKKFNLFYLFLVAGFISPFGSVSLYSHSTNSKELVFETADPLLREVLINFAIESNDIYQTRSESINVAKEVFDILESDFENGVVQVLKLGEEIVGFYTLKIHMPRADWFEHELGHLFVKAGLQNQGFGTLLFNHAISTARAKGWEKLEWLCDPDAEIFYSKMGATVIGHCENLLNPSVDLPIFVYYLKNKP
ncbi:MAG: GNAT family N-acetyltransferase [Simkaniaceae bacterium]|nr:GNAT family N-acetyltransferase [Candidatus Sacchlamyda saccharinae]